MNTTTFDTWLTKQLAEGLVDIKFAILAGKDVSVEAIQRELLAAEASISAGFLRIAPGVTSMIPEQVSNLITQVTAR